MSRINIEDCIKVVGNRFRLVMYGAQRGREIARGMLPAIDEPIAKHDKSAVIALREIVQGQCDQEALEQSIIRNHRRYSPIEAAPEGAQEGEQEGAQEGAQESAVEGTVAGAVEGAVTGAVTSGEQPVQVTDSSVADSAVAEAAIDTSDTGDTGAEKSSEDQ